MSLCPSSSHQLVAAAIAFRRARRKFPKDFGLESTVERASLNTKTQETATCREGLINQARSSSTLNVKRACNLRSNHVCPTSVRNRDYERSWSKESSISCSCCRTRNIGEDISELRNECSGGDAVDTVPSRECEESTSSDADHKNGFAKPVEPDRCDVSSRMTEDGEAIKTTERIPQSARSTFYHHCKERCQSRPRTNVDPVNRLCDSVPHERHDKVACGDFTGDRGKDFESSCHGTPIDLDVNAKEGLVTSDTPGHGPAVEDTWMRASTSATHPRKIVDSIWRCQCECHPREDSISNPPSLSCDRCNRCRHHRHNYHCDYHDCVYRHCCWEQRDNSYISAKRCEMRGNGTSGEKAQHKSSRDRMRGENGRLYAQRCYLKEYSGIIPASRERNDEGEERRREKGGDDNDGDEDDDNDDEDEDGDVAVINHKDSMCILAEKYKAGRKWRGGRCWDRMQSGDRDKEGVKDERNKSLTSEIIDQPESPLESVNAVPHEGPSVKHICQAAHRESCGTAAIARTCGRGCSRHEPPEGEFDRLKSPSNETAAATRCCSTRAQTCRHVF
ncbi:hypothetical protein P5V15_011998 [Pogonomyrmex californicus]